MKKHFVKVWTEGDVNSPNYKIKACTDDGKVYIINIKDYKKQQVNKC